MARRDQGSVVALVFLVLFCSVSVVSSGNNQGVDQELATGENVVTATVNRIRQSDIFGADHDFLRRMAKVADFGEGIVTRMGGIWRVHEDIVQAVNEYLSLPCAETQQNPICLQNQLEDELCVRWFMDVEPKGYAALDVPLYSALYVMIYLTEVTNHTIPDSIEWQATETWKIINEDGDPQEFIDAANDLQGEQCQIVGVDMVFVMDVSGSIGPGSFEKMKDLAINITSAFEIEPNRTHVGWVNFNNSAWVVFNLTGRYEEELNNSIKSIEYTGGGTAIGEGLDTLRSQGFSSARNRFEIPEVAIVVTDGKTNRGINTAEAAERLRMDRNVNMFAVGVGSGVNTEELKTVASAGIEHDENNPHIYHISNFVERELTNLQQIIRSQVCSDAMDNPQPIQRLNRKNINIPQGATAHATVNCTQGGLTFSACGHMGTTTVYVSSNSSPNSANYDQSITAMAGNCRNMFVRCRNGSGRRKRQDTPQQRIFVTIEGVEEENEYDLAVTPGDSSTPQVNLLCRKVADLQSVVVSCTQDRELTDIECSINGSPLDSCTLPWRVPFAPPIREYTLRIDVVDSLNLTDTVVLKHRVGPLVLDCSLNPKMEIVCSSSKLLAVNKTICSFRDTTINQCALPYKIDVKGWPLGAHRIGVSATDVFGSTAQENFEYLVVADRVGDDMVFSVVLDVRPIEVSISDQTVSLCYQVHGEEDKFYNLVSDDCVSINAHVTQPISGVNSHVMDKIGIRAIGNNATYCYDIGIARENCAVTVNGHPVSLNEKFKAEGIEVFNDRLIARNPNVIRISVPNCGRALVDTINIMCTEYQIRNSPTPTEVLELQTMRGVSPIKAAQGLVGQFWGRFTLGQSQTPLPSPRQRYDKAMMIFHGSTTQRFNGFTHRSWSRSGGMCFYAGDRQGFPVIQGEFRDYEVETMFSAEYGFSRFKQDMCMPTGGSEDWNG